jgi:hypothetical protein
MLTYTYWTASMGVAPSDRMPPNQTNSIYVGGYQYTQARDFGTVIKMFDDKSKKLKVFNESIEPKVDFFTIVGRLYDIGKDEFIRSLILDDLGFTINICEPEYYTEYASLFNTITVRYGDKPFIRLVRELPSAKYVKRNPQRKIRFKYIAALNAHVDRIISELEAARLKKHDQLSA